MKDNLAVIVGRGQCGKEYLSRAIAEQGFEVVNTDAQWPRDHFVHFMGRYVKSGSPGFIDGNAFGEGGNILTGNDFLLVSDMAYIHEHIAEKLPNNSTYAQTKKAIISEGKRYYPDARIHVAPTGYFHGGKEQGHIDMFCLLIPEQKILLIDTHHGKNAKKAKEYDEIAEIEGLKLIRYDGSQDNVWYPLNSLVLPNGNGDIVFADYKAESLIKLLKDEGAEVVEVKMPQIKQPAGRIHCQTNTFSLKDGLTEDDLIDKTKIIAYPSLNI